MAVTAQDLKALLVERHQAEDPLSKWALFFELRNCTGAGRAVTRYADAFAINLWPSSGYTRIAYEIKVSRGDFLAELKRPEKRHWAMEICHQFWFVCAPGIVEPEEIPEACGLLLATKNGKKLRAVKQAQHREVRDLAMTEVAALARQACDREAYSDLRWKYAGREISKEQLDEIIASQRADAERRHIERRAEEIARGRLEHIEKSIKTYADAMRRAGVKPPRWMDIPLTRQQSEWIADHWVRDNVAPGPGLGSIATAIRQVEAAQSAAERAVKQLEELMKRQQAMTPEEVSHARA